MTDEEYLAGISACLEPAAVSAVKDIDTRIKLSTALSLMRISQTLVTIAKAESRNSWLLDSVTRGGHALATKEEETHEQA